MITKEEVNELLLDAHHVDRVRCAGGPSQLYLDPETVQDLCESWLSMKKELDHLSIYKASLGFILQWKHGSISTDMLDSLCSEILDVAKKENIPILNLDESTEFLTKYPRKDE